MHVPEESDSGIVPMNHSNNDGGPSAESEEGRLLIKENTFHLTRTRHCAGLRVSQGWASVRTNLTFVRHSSAIRAACANQRSCGSARGAISDGRPYRDLTTGLPTAECRPYPAPPINLISLRFLRSRPQRCSTR
jgi:hypothetical protein